MLIASWKFTKHSQPNVLNSVFLSGKFARKSSTSITSLRKSPKSHPIKLELYKIVTIFFISSNLSLKVLNTKSMYFLQGNSSNGRDSVSSFSVENVVRAPVIQPIGAHEWRVICDSSLGELAKYLRMCGCDCVYMEFDQAGDQTVKSALHESRTILTTSSNIEKVNIQLIIFNLFDDPFPNKNV